MACRGPTAGNDFSRLHASEIVDCLERMNIGILFVIGGDGTLRGAMQIARVAAERGCRIAVVGIPKTIDNDIPYIDQSFGFQTAFAEATNSIRSAHVEAKASPNGVGLVKLMGRHSGFIACYAIRSVEANPFDSVYCLRMAQNAVHAALASRTEMVVGRWRGRYIHIPMALAVSRRNEVCPDGDLWLSVLEATGQPAVFT